MEVSPSAMHFSNNQYDFELTKQKVLTLTDDCIIDLEIARASCCWLMMAKNFGKALYALDLRVKRSLHERATSPKLTGMHQVT